MLAGCGYLDGYKLDFGPATTTPGRDDAARKTFIDDLGYKVAVTPSPQRIVSLAPSITEILFSLELGAQIVGVTTYCNYPPATAAIDKVGDTLHPNLEKIISLRPDLVIMSTASQLEQLRVKLLQAGIPVFVVKAQSLEQTLHSIEAIGELVNRGAQAHALAEQLRARIEKIKAQVAGKPHPKIFFVVGADPLITAGKAAFITDLIELAGGQSISADVVAEWPAYSAETVVARAPDIILIPGADHGGALTLPASLQTTPAARNGHTYQIDGDLILRPGPRIVDGLEQMARLFHTEAQ